ncbi:toll/interleukin-1 receptor domain-containing protein [Bradyrhizobium sp. DASA03076]|uniref:toll/interleukin-1 receptor domain-containing protein n=1 Tax=Bradyrhizobium sp. BLXBL-03 TaxID=3395916 RepID=UPI003F71F842
MADVCILYARKDARRQAKKLVELLEPNWSVWWDHKIDSGDYRQEIHNQLKLAGCVIPIWSGAAQFSAVLHDELAIAIKGNVPILPLRIHDVDAPLGFGAQQTTDAIAWNGDEPTTNVIALVDRIARVLEKRRSHVRRPAAIPLCCGIQLPTLFFSVSSHETQLSPGAAIDALNVFRASTALISAYDLHSSRKPPRGLVPAIRELRSRGATILLDSGFYEKARRSDKSWTVRKYHDVLERVPHDAAFCFDDVDLPSKTSLALRSLVSGIRREQQHTKKPLIPVIHLARDRAGNYKVDPALELMKLVALETKPILIAIPERELGSGIIERARTMRRIRETLNELYYYQPVHVLGTGTPVSVALLAAAGADSFDGLEWCRFVADNETKTLHHFQHYDLFKWQDDFALSAVTLEARKDPAVRYAGRTIFHNLDFFTNWMDELRSALGDDKRLVEFMTTLLPKRTMTLARDALPGVL